MYEAVGIAIFSEMIIVINYICDLCDEVEDVFHYLYCRKYSDGRQVSNDQLEFFQLPSINVILFWHYKLE